MSLVFCSMSGVAAAERRREADDAQCRPGSEGVDSGSEGVDPHVSERQSRTTRPGQRAAALPQAAAAAGRRVDHAWSTRRPHMDHA